MDDESYPGREKKTQKLFKAIDMVSPKVVVTILSYNGKSLLEEVLSSYKENNYPNFQILIIDNGSTDGTCDWVQQNYPDVFILRTEKNLGYSGGFNFGLDYVFNQMKADYALISNNDVKADKEVVHSLLEVAQKDNSIGFVTGKVFFYDHPDVLQSVGYFEEPLKWIGGHLGNKEKDVGQFDLIEERPFSDDIFMLVKRELFLDTRGYDENFNFQSEQFDWQIRARRKGYKVYYTPYAKIWHKDSITIGKMSPFKKYYDVRNSFVVRLKHRDKSYLKKFFSFYFKNIVIMPFLKNLAKGNIKMAWAICTGFISAFIWGVRHKKIPFRNEVC